MTIDTKNLKINLWSVKQRMTALEQMDQTLRKMNVVTRGTIWQNYGGGLRATEEETKANWKRIAEDDEAFLNAIFCYVCCTLEPFTLQSFSGVNFKK